MTARWVIDCSFAAALTLPDEASSHVQTFFLEKSSDELWGPSLWWYELTNVLTVAERRRILTKPDVEKAVSLYGRLIFRTDATEGIEYVDRLLELTRLYGLSAYDASYLELALRKRAQLVTLYRQLLEAAENSSVETWR